MASGKHSQSVIASLPAIEIVFPGHTTQVVAVVAAVVVEYLPASQSVHAAEPDKGLYLPAAHETQLCASGPVWPAGHPGRQVLAPVAEYVPAAQSSQDDAPANF